MILLVWSALALAGEVAVVHPGDTVESIAAGLGDESLAPVLRGENGLGPGAQPVVGTLLRLPAIAGHVDQDAVVSFLAGSGVVTVPGQVAAPAAEGVALPEGSVVCTDEDSYATVRLAVDVARGQHDDINLHPETCVVIEAAASHDGGRSSAVRMQRGRLEVRAADAAGLVAIMTDAGVTSGVSGGFRVAIEASGAARTEALAAPVQVMAQGVQRDMHAGQGSRTVPGEAPSEPIDLLPAGHLQRPFDGARLLRPDFTWTAVAGALGYRFEIATAPDFSELVYTTEVPEQHFEADGLYLPFRVAGLWWRVTTFDLTGFEGVPSAPRRLTFPDGLGP